MARFCTYCGTPLEEGQTCVCRQQAAAADPNIQQTNQVPQQPPQPQHQEYQQVSQPNFEQASQYQQPYQQQYQPEYQQTNPQPQAQYAPQFQQPVYKENESAKFMKRMLAISTAFIKNPASTVKESAKQADVFTGFFFAAALALMMSLYSLVMIKSSGLGSLLSFSGSSFSYYVGTFFRTLLSGAVQYFILTAIIFGISKIFKSQCKYKSLLSGIGVASIPVTAGITVAMVFTWFLPSLAFLVIIFGILMSIILAVPMLTEISAMDENKITYTIALSYLAYYSIYLLVIVQQLKLSAAGMIGSLF